MAGASALQKRTVTSWPASRQQAQLVAARNSLALLRWRLALGGRAAAPADIMFFGDSITAGYQATALAKRWATVLPTILRTRYPTPGVTGGAGYQSARHMANASGNYPDDPFANVGGAQTAYPAFGLDLVSWTLSATGQSITWTFTGTGFDIDYTKYVGGGTFSWSVDGGAATNVATSAGAIDTGTPVVQIRSLAAASHTVTCTWVSGTSFINGGFAYNGDEAAGIRGTVLATVGFSTSLWLPTSSASRFWTASVARRPPDLVFITLGANDFGSSTARVTPATFKANLQTMITAIKAGASGYVPSFVLMPVWSMVTTLAPLAPYNDYVAVQYQIAAEDPDGAVAVLDLQQRVNPGAAGGTVGGFLPDKTHPADAGNQAVAEMVADFLAVQ